jgi:hypothetical protein
MSNLGLASRYLRLEFKQWPQGIILHQRSFSTSLFFECGISNYNPLNIPFTKALKLQADMNSFEVDLIYYNQSLVGKLFFFLQTQDLTLQINICKDLNNHIKKLPNQSFNIFKKLLNHGYFIEGEQTLLSLNSLM